MFLLVNYQLGQFNYEYSRYLYYIILAIPPNGKQKKIYRMIIFTRQRTHVNGGRCCYIVITIMFKAVGQRKGFTSLLVAVLTKGNET